MGSHVSARPELSGPKKQPDGKETAQWQINFLKAFEEAQEAFEIKPSLYMKMPEMPQSRRRWPLKKENKIQKDKNEKKNRDKKKKDYILFNYYNKEEARITYNIKYRMIKASV